MKDCVDSERVPQDKASALVRLATRGRQSSTGSKQLKILVRNVIMCRVLSSRSRVVKKLKRADGPPKYEFGTLKMVLFSAELSV